MLPLTIEAGEAPSFNTAAWACTRPRMRNDAHTAEASASSTENASSNPRMAVNCSRPIHSITRYSGFAFLIVLSLLRCFLSQHLVHPLHKLRLIADGIFQRFSAAGFENGSPTRFLRAIPARRRRRFRRPQGIAPVAGGVFHFTHSTGVRASARLHW